MGSWVCLELVIVAAFLQKDGCLLVVQPPKLASVGFWHMAAETISGVWNLPAHVARFIGIVVLWVICNINLPNDSHPSLILTLVVWKDTAWVIYNTNSHSNSHPTQTGGMNSHCLGCLQHNSPKWLPSISLQCYTCVVIAWVICHTNPPKCLGEWVIYKYPLLKFLPCSLLLWHKFCSQWLQ